MNYRIDNSGGPVDITVVGLTVEQGKKVADLVTSLAFEQPEELDEVLHVPASEVAAIIAHIQTGKTLYNGVDPAGLPNKISDIRYVRSVASCGLKEAKEWVEKVFPARYQPTPARAPSSY